jgi:hypothetical protein
MRKFKYSKYSNQPKKRPEGAPEGGAIDTKREKGLRRALMNLTSDQLDDLLNSREKLRQWMKDYDCSQS